MTARTVVLSGALLATAFLSGCKSGDASSDTSSGETATLLGPENIIVVKAQELRTGPTLSGTIEAEREASVRAELNAAVLQTFADTPIVQFSRKSPKSGKVDEGKNSR